MLLRIDGLDDRTLFKRVRELNQRLHDVRVANLLGQRGVIGDVVQYLITQVFILGVFVA